MPSIALKADSNPPLRPLRMLYVATAIDPLPSARDGVHGAVSTIGFPPWYVHKMEKNPQLGPHTTPRPLTRDAGLTPLDAPSGGEREQSVGSRYREGMATTKGIGTLMASQRALSIECL
jgi:hypothetical protein